MKKRMLIFTLDLLLLLQLWTTVKSDCGAPPSVNLTCGHNQVNASWDSGGCAHSLCKGYLNCTNGIGSPYLSETHDATCYSTFEFLNIPMDYYYCTVAVYYRYFDDDYNLLQSPDTKEACAYNITGVRLTAIGSQNVGEKLSLRCDVNITEGIATNIYIQWKINNTVVKDYSLHSMTSVTEFLNLTLLQISDNHTIYQCLAMISKQQNQIISTDFDEFRLIANIPKNGLQPMECSVPIESGVSEDLNIIWMTDDGSVVKTVQNVPGDERGNTTIYRHTLWRKINDKTTYKCRLTLSSNPLLSQLEPIDIELSSVNVIALNYQNISVGEPLHLHCSVNITHLNSSVDFIWRANDVELNRTTVNRTSNTSDIVSDLFDLYDIKLLKQEDNNTEYNCRVVVNGSPLLTEFGIFNLIMPPSNSSATNVTASSSQITSPVSLGTGSSNLINSTTMTTTTEGSSLAFIIAPSLAALLALLILTFIVSILWKRRKSASSKVIYHTIPPLSDTDYYLAISREQMSTCETVSDRTSWIDPDSSSIISGEMLNYIMYAHRTNPEVLNNLPLNLQSRATSQRTLSLCRSSLSLNHFSESNMMKYIKENDNLMSPKYVDYHTAKQLSDADGDINDASSQNLLSEIVEMQSTPKHNCVFSFDIQQRMPN